MRVLIVGGGIGGLTTALCLHEAGIEAVVYESAPALKELGVGINLLPHAVRELSALGVQPALASTAVETAALAYYTRYGRLIHSEPRGLRAGYQWPQFSIHRGRLLMILARAAQARLGAVFHSDRPSLHTFRAGRRRRDGALRRSGDRCTCRQGPRRRADRGGRHSLVGPSVAVSRRGSAEVLRRHDVARRDRAGTLPRWPDDGHRRQLAHQGGGLSDLAGGGGARLLPDQLGGRNPRREQDGVALGGLGPAGQEGRFRSGIRGLALRLAGRASPV